MKKTWLNAEGLFQYLTAKQLEELAEEQYAAYKEDEAKFIHERIEALEKKDDSDDPKAAKEIAELKDALVKLQNQTLKDLQKRVLDLGEEIAKAKKEGNEEQLSAFHKAISDLSEQVTAVKAREQKGFELEINKADVTYADLTQTGQLDQLQAGISDVVKKRPLLYDLFRKIPMTTETYTYLQQDPTLIRDAQGVAKCTKGFTSLTKEEISVVRTTDVKIKDTVDICRDYMDDYAWVEARYMMLLNDSVNFLVDTELLLGTDTTTSLNSIDNVSSEFDPNNVDAPIGPSIDFANFADLMLGMSAQIEVLGRLNGFIPNVAIVNKMDWFIKIESKKDQEGRYLDPRISKVNGQWYVGDLLIIPHVDCVANTCYVFDSTKGAILDRMMTTLRISEENGTNFVDEFITMMASTRLQFLVEQNNANAFMKCSDVDTAVTAITAP